MSPRRASALRLVRSEPVAHSDGELVARALAGEVTARETLYLRHVDYVAGLAAKLLRSVEWAEDVAQDSFVTAFEQLGALRDPEAFRSWLASIAVSFVRRRLRKQRVLRFVGLDTGHDDGALDRLASTDASPEVRAELAALDLVLTELPSDHRIAWMLRNVEGDSLEDVARACGCSLATVKRWISAADAHVTARMKDDGDA